MSETTEKLGRWHKWWMRQFLRAYQEGIKARKSGEKRDLGIAVWGYDGTVQGKALIGLINRELIKFKVGFESGLAILTITEKGLSYVSRNDR